MVPPRSSLARPASFPTLPLGTPEICSIDLLTNLSPKVTILISVIHPWVSAESGNSRGNSQKTLHFGGLQDLTTKALPRKAALSALNSFAVVFGRHQCLMPGA